jgi:hypothetical protein
MARQLHPQAGSIPRKETTMSVTDNDFTKIGELESRNADSANVTDNNLHEIANLESCNTPVCQCRNCKQMVPLGEPVWITYRKTWEPRKTTCAKCEAKHIDRDFHPPRPCECCGRPVYRVASLKWPRKHNFCGDGCASRWWTRWQAERRRAMRQPVTCEGCDKQFTPVRKDAHFCSSACRQRSYRQRQAVIP